jgi:hypothetical protein
MRGSWSAAERKSAAGTGAVVAVWLVTTLLWLTPGLTRPDGVGYYAYLTSTWFDRDLLFIDEWAQAGLIRNGQFLFKDITATNHLSNHWTAGASLAWYPAFVAADGVGRWALGVREASAAGDGQARASESLPPNAQRQLSAMHIAAVTFMSALAGLFVLLSGVHIARRFFSEGIAVAAAIAIWLGSPLAWYSLRHASMSHALSAAVCSGVVLLSLRLREEMTLKRVFSLGLAIGFACAVRPQNIAIALVPLFIADLRPLIRRAHALLLGGLIAALPQLIVSTILYGGPLVFVNIGGRAHSWQMFARFRPLETIFSWYHGLATWTPLLAIAIVGLVLLHRHDRGLARAGLATFAAQWLLLSSLERWFWGGASFGQRRFDSCTIFFILGIAAVLHRLPRWLAATLTIAATAYTMVLFIAATQLNLNRFQTPDQLFAAFQNALSDPAWRSFLGFTPKPLHATVLLAALVTTIVVTLIFLIGRKAGTIIATVYLLAMSAFYAWCGVHPHYGEVERFMLARHVRGQLTSAAARDTIGLLRDEAEYMHRVGRHEDAEAALREAAAIRP